MPPRAPGALPNVFYLDDPQDGVSTLLLASLGVELHAGVPPSSHVLASALGSPSLLSIALPPTAGAAGAIAFPTPVAYAPSEGSGGVLLDVRDSGGAWVRLILHPGDAAALVRGGVAHRLAPAAEATAPWARAAAAADAVVAPLDAGARASTTALAPHVAGRLTALRSGGSALLLHAGGGAAPIPVHVDDAAAAAEADAPYFSQRGRGPHTRVLVSELCASFYTLGWVTGTGGSISVRTGDRIFMAPSSVQKERMQPADMFVLDAAGAQLYAPAPLPGRAQLRLSQCAPLFQHAFSLRRAGAAIHTHDMNAVLVTLMGGGTRTEFCITHSEMIKGIAGHGFADECVVPIIENTAHECDLADSLGAAMEAYPRANAVLVRRHGVYVWGETWEAAKTQAECYHYLFELALRMEREAGVDPAAVPRRVVEGAIGAATSYGSGGERASPHDAAVAAARAAAGANVSVAVPAHVGTCCGNDAPHAHEATSEGFHGSRGTNAANVGAAVSGAAAPVSALPLPSLASYDAVVLDVEGCTTSLAFVTETLFPYAAAHVRGWLTQRWGASDAEGREARGDVAALCLQAQADAREASTASSPAPPALDEQGVLRAWDEGLSGGTAALDAVCAYVSWAMGVNRKSGALKSLQGHVWRHGYTTGQLIGQVFPDTAPSLTAWRNSGKKSYIYSSGSREAQRLLFKYSSSGDLRPLLCGYFDTAVGVKVESSSYRDIALSLGVDCPSRVLFATDSLAEAHAALGAGMQCVLTAREGNLPLPPQVPCAVVSALADLF